MPLPSLGGLGGGGGGGLPHLANVDIGSLIQAAQPPGWLQFLQGVSQIPGIAQQSMATMSDAMEKREQMKDLQMQVGTAQWNNTIAMIQKNPDLASSPQIISKLQQLSTVTGNPLPMTSTGAIDQSVWGASFTEFMKDPDFQQRWWAATPHQRQAMVDTMHLAGVSPEAINVEPVLTAKEQNAIDLFGIKQSDIDDRNKNRDLQSTALYGATGTGGYYGARSWQAYADGHASLTRAAAAMQTATDNHTKVNAAVWEAKQKVGEFYAGLRNKLDIATLQERGKMATAALQAASTAMNDEAKNMSTAFGAGVDENDPAWTQMSQQYKGNQQWLQSTQQAFGAAYQGLGSGQASNAHLSKTTSAQTAKPTTVTTPGSGQPPPFNVPPGYHAEQRGGQWGVVDANGKWWQWQGP